jgi:Fe-S-cluster containining protein
MNLEEKSQEVKRIFDELDNEIRSFLDKSQLGCIPGCGQCCSNPTVSATILEFLPLAFDLYEKGKAELALEILEKQNSNDFCILYKSMSFDHTLGFCSNYTNRGMICRLFGSSSRKKKDGQKELITCKKIKSEKKELFEKASQEINVNMVVPSGSAAYTKLYNVDFQLTNQQFPINFAIKKALEMVLTFKFYSDNQEPEIPENF